MHWQQNSDPSEREKVDDQAFLERKVRETQQSLLDLIRSGLAPHEAEIQVLRDMTLTD